MMRRDWTEANAVHRGRPCQRCGTSANIELAHTIGRKFDGPRAGRSRRVLYVHPDAVARLCGPFPHGCHGLFDHGEVNLLPHLTANQVGWAIERLGHGEAMRRLMGPAWKEAA